MVGNAADRWRRIEDAYHGARDRSGDDRLRFLDEACGSDVLMRRQVEGLLASDAHGDSLLDGPLSAQVCLSERERLAAGSRMGPYEVLEPIGSGGMADVYRAHDTRLLRDVALKVLPFDLSSGRHGLLRFMREAQALAALNHPNIAQVYGLEECGSRYAIAMELVDGETLAERLARGPLEVAEVLRIARDIAEAVEAAHAEGIVHRDLKPANIKMRHDGTVKVLDFGLAKPLGTPMGLAREASASAPITDAVSTGAGVVLGTAAYMSPEQVKGGDVDKRSDVWAFGCVLYEMVAGKRAFTGENVGDTLSAVLREAPDWSVWPDDVRPQVRELVDGCLEKDPKQRIADISTARFLLKERPEAAVALPKATPLYRPAHILLFIAVAIIVVIGAAVTWRTKPATNNTVPAVTRFSFALAEDQQFTNAGRPLLAISPDGTQVVYVANQRLYLRRMSEPDARPIPGTETLDEVTSPVFSPDGQYIVFWSGADHTLKRIAVSGGTPFTICPAEPLFGMSWGANGILFGQAGKGIMRVRPDGGMPELLVSAKARNLASDPQALPDDRGTLFTLRPEGRGGIELWDKARIVVQASRGSEPITLIDGGSSGRYLATGHIVYAVEGRLLAVTFDLRNLSVTSAPVPVLDGVARTPNTPAAQFDVSNTGSLVYIQGPVSASTRPPFNIAVLDRNGKVEVLKLPPGAYESPRVSPHGNQLAVGVGDYKQADIWIYDLAGTSAMRRLTFGGTNRFPIWSADGRSVAFQSDREGDRAVFWQRADISGPMAERLTRPEPGSSHIPESWSPQDDGFAYSVFSDSSGRFTLSVFSVRDKQPHALPGIQSTLPLASEFSPNGRWLSYSVSEARVGPARATVFVEPFPVNGAKYQISQSRNGFHPVWLPDGKGLSYSTGIGPDGPQWVTANVTLEPRVTVGSVAKVSNGGLLDSVPFGPVNERNYDFTPDGRRVGLFPTEANAVERQTVINVVLNWFDELRRRAPTR